MYTMSEMQVVLNPAVDYSVKQSSHPSYRTVRIIPQSNQNIDLSAGSTVQTQIEVPNVVHNAMRSNLYFEMVIPLIASNVINAYSLGAPFDSAIYASRDNVEVARVDNCDIYTASVLPYLVSSADFLTFPNSRGKTDSASVADVASTTQRGFNLFPNDTTLATSTPGPTCGRNGTRILNSATAGTYLFGANDKPYNEMQYFRQSTISKNIRVAHSFPLWAIGPHTLLSVDKDMFYDQNMMLTLNWVPSDYLGFIQTAVNTLPTAGNGAISSTVSITNIRLDLAVETNGMIAEVIKQKVKSQGLSLPIPFVRSYNFNLSTVTTAPNLVQRLNIGNGQRLLNIYNVLMENSAVTVARHNKSNVAQAKCTSYQNQLNSLNLSENRIDESLGDGWVRHRDLCAGSCISSADVYDHNRVNILSFRNGKCVDWLKQDTDIDGIDLSNEQTISIDQTTPSKTCRQYLFVVTQKQLEISPQGQVSLR